jgi:hypothetical protein
MDGDLQKIYDQDCQFVRYQDGLMWSRLQTAMAVEGGMLYGLYGNSVHLGSWDRPALALLGALFVLLACCVTFADRADIQSHLARIREFERAASREFVHAKLPWLKAPTFLLLVGVFLTAANLVILKQIIIG